MNPGTDSSPGNSDLEVAGLSSSPVLPHGQSLTSSNELDAPDQRAPKKQKSAEDHDDCAEHTLSKVPTGRKKPRRRRGKRKIPKCAGRVARRKTYIMQRLPELEKRGKESEALIERLRLAMIHDETSLILADDGNEDEAAIACSAHEGVEVDAPPGLAAALTHTQRLRLTHQAATTLEVLRRLRDRDLLMVHHLEEELRMCESEIAARSTRGEKGSVDVLDEASFVRQENSLLIVAAQVAEEVGLEIQASTILSWYREFRRLDGHFKRDTRGVHERAWILSEEDKQLQMLQWLKGQEHISIKSTQEYINNELFADEEGLLRLKEHGLSLPISSSTVHTWMAKLGCRFDRVKNAFYVDAQESSEAREWEN